jgi:hypothetical protein
MFKGLKILTPNDTHPFWLCKFAIFNLSEPQSPHLQNANKSNPSQVVIVEIK